jgi:hypothetical protein
MYGYLFELTAALIVPTASALPCFPQNFLGEFATQA